MAHRFEIKKSKNGEYRVRFVYNSEVIFTTEGYDTKAGAKRSIESIKKYVPQAEIAEEEDA